MNFIRRAIEALRRLIDSEYRAQLARQEVQRAFNPEALQRHPEALRELVRIKQAEQQAKAVIPAVIDAITNPQDSAAERRYGSALKQQGAQVNTGASLQGASTLQRILNTLQAPQRGAVAWTTQIAGPGSKYASGVEAWTDDAEWGALLENYFPELDVNVRRALAIPMDLILDPAIVVNAIRPAVLARRALHQQWLDNLDEFSRILAMSADEMKAARNKLAVPGNVLRAVVQRLLNPEQYAIAAAHSSGRPVSLVDVLRRKESLASLYNYHRKAVQELQNLPRYAEMAARELEQSKPATTIIWANLPEGVREIIEKKPEVLAHSRLRQLLKPEERQALGEALARVSLRTAPLMQVRDVQLAVDQEARAMQELLESTKRLSRQDREDLVSKLNIIRQTVHILSPADVKIRRGTLTDVELGLMELLRQRRQQPPTYWEEIAAQLRQRLENPTVANALSILSRFVTGEPLQDTFAWQRIQVDKMPERVEWITKKLPVPYADILGHTISKLGQGVQNTPYRFIQLARILRQLTQ